jgi:ribosomal protein S24E
VTTENESNKSSVETTTGASGKVQVKVKVYADTNDASDVEAAGELNVSVRSNVIRKLQQEGVPLAGE